MTEAEKHALAQQLLAAEQAHLASKSPFTPDTTALSAIAQRATQHQRIKASLAQHGITWEELKAAYDKAYATGRRDALRYHLSFFYSATAIAFHERFKASPEETEAFFASLPIVLDKSQTNDMIITARLEKTGIDTSIYNASVSCVGPSRQDAKAIERMKRTGITEKDVEFEEKVGYNNGRNSVMNMGVCFAAVGLTLSHKEFSSADIEAFFDRIVEITDEEISASDIIERTKEEAGVDVTGLVEEEVS